MGRRWALRHASVVVRLRDAVAAGRLTAAQADDLLRQVDARPVAGGEAGDDPVKRMQAVRMGLRPGRGGEPGPARR